MAEDLGIKDGNRGTKAGQAWRRENPRNKGSEIALYGCFGSPYNKDHNMFGSILGPPIYGSPHMCLLSPKTISCCFFSFCCFQLYRKGAWAMVLRTSAVRASCKPETSLKTSRLLVNSRGPRDQQGVLEHASSWTSDPT